MEMLATDGAGVPTRWLIVFRRTGAWWIPGRYKHVRAFAYVAECDTYVFYDVGFGKTTIFLARGRGARAVMLEWTDGADVLAFTPRGTTRIVQPVLCCTTAIRHLIGLPGSALLWPDRLYRLLLKYGAQPVGQTACPAAGPADRPDPRRAGPAGAAGEHRRIANAGAG